jgi:PHD/YefM family antitoxin component YafN of YafNO toxin-antitoxin module
MLHFKKQIVTDESMRPVAVLIDYQDWQKIEELLEAYELQEKEKENLSKYAGVINLTVDPLEYQQQVRDEWH